MRARATDLELLMRPRWHRFLSPHYDDIALSCGGTATLLAEGGHCPEIVVVFGAESEPGVPLSPYAAAMHRSWGFDATEVNARRRAEEQAASMVMGTTFRALPFRDAIYRGEAYLSDRDLFDTVSTSDRWLPPSIVSAAGLAEAPDPASRVYAPLAVGRHVDHQVVFQAAVQLAKTGWEVWFYEDLPYALWNDALPDRLATAEVDLARVASVDITATWGAKIDAILAYRSQLGAVFSSIGSSGNRDEIDALLGTYAAGAEDGRREERFWRVLRSDGASRTSPS